MLELKKLIHPKFTFIFFTIFISLMGCATKNATYQASANLIYTPPIGNKTTGKESVYMYRLDSDARTDTDKDEGIIVFNQCVNSLIQKHGKPKNIKRGKRHIYNCLEENGWTVLVEEVVSA